MEREDIARMAIGLMVLLLPYAGAFTVLPLAAVFFLNRGSRLLCASLAMLLIMRPVLSLTDTNLPLYVIAISFVASTFAPLAFKKFDSLTGSIMYLLINVGLGYPVASLISGGSLSSERILFLVILGGLSGAFLHHVSKDSKIDVALSLASLSEILSMASIGSVTLCKALKFLRRLNC